MDIKRLATSGLDSRLTESSTKSTDKTSTSANGNAKSATKTADTVTLSSMKDIGALEQKAKTSSVDNSARVAELKQRVQDGTYQVNASQVANKLIETEALFSGA